MYVKHNNERTMANTNGMNLTRQQVLNVIERTRNNKEAWEYLGISRPTWKKYAELYYHEDYDDMTLYEYHKFQSAKDKGIANRVNTKVPRYDLRAILRGEHPEYKSNNLKRRIINNGVLLEKCNNCGYDERRLSDYTVPLILHYKDDNLKNHKLENLEFLCYNCFYVLVGDFKSNTNRKNNTFPKKDEITDKRSK